MREDQDAIGHAMYDHLHKDTGYEITERDDGYFDVSQGPDLYFTEYDQWSEHVKKAVEYVRGSVLDIGCGAGRFALYLQKNGCDVTGIDISSLAVKTCKDRGLKKVYVASIDEISADLGTFDTIMMMGNNFGLLEGYTEAKNYLNKFKTITTKSGRIIAESRDPYQTDVPEHAEYQKFNTERGRMPGQLRLRVHYKKYVTPWFNYLIVSKDEMIDILAGTGWEVHTFIDGKHGIYVAVIDKE
ncbi:MAG: methyltransferase domain-containing protein [Candidatus Methanofastidiosia archaeon]